MKRIIFALATPLLLAACGSERSGTITNEDGETVDYNIDASGGESTFTAETDEGTATVRTGTNVKVDLPDGFSLYPGAKVVTNSVMNQGDGEATMLIMQSDDSPEKVAAFYRKQAEDAGVKIEMEMKTAQGTMLGGKGADDTIFSVNVSEQNGGTTAQLTVGRGLDS